MKRVAAKLDAVVWVGVLLVVILAPTQYSFELHGIHLSAVDPVIWIVAALGVLAWLMGGASKDQRREDRDCGEDGRREDSGGAGVGKHNDGHAEKKARRSETKSDPPTPSLYGGVLAPATPLVFFALVALSVVRAAHQMSAIKDVVQYVEYFLVGYLLFRNAAASQARARVLVLCFLTVATAVLAIGVFHYFSPGTDDFLVRATFRNRNVFGGFLALSLPLAFGLLLYDRCTWRRIWYGLLVVAGLLTTLSLATMIALVGVCALMAVSSAERSFLAYAGAVILIFVFVLDFLPRDNPAILRDSIAFFDVGRRVEPDQRYPEWQAAFKMAQDHPWLGVGVNNYQENVGQYYGVLPSAATKTEPDSQNLYLVLASSVGLPGLLAFLGVLGIFLSRALRGVAADNAWQKGVALGAAGAIAAFAINAFWAPLIVRGIGLPLVLVLVFADLTVNRE